MRGAGMGALTTGATACYVVLWAPIIGPLLCVPAAVGGAVVGGLVGAPVGAALAEATGKIDEQETMVRQATTALSLHGALRDRVITAGRQQTTHSFHALPGGRAEGSDRPDTIIEVTVERIALEGPQLVNPPLSFIMPIRTRVRRATDETLLYEHSLVYQSPAHPLDDWLANDALRFRQEVERALSSLAEKIIDEIFLVTR